MIIRFFRLPILTAMVAVLASFAHVPVQASNSHWQDILTPVSSASTLNDDILIRQGEQWWDSKWGARGVLYQKRHDDLGLDGSSHLAIDIKRRLFSSQENSFLAIGLGWDDIELTGDQNTTGMRFVAEGRYNLFGPAYLFGQAAITPWLSGIDSMADPFGSEVEFGLVVNPFPSMSLRAGFRNYWLDSYSQDIGISPYDNRNNGLFIGGGIDW